jgi:ribosomal protein L32
MSSLTNCPECNHEILSRLGTVCPECGHTIGYFNGDKKRKAYGKFFALTVFTPFISLITILFASQNKYTMIIGALIYLFLAVKSCPLLFKEIFFTNFEKVFFWLIWILANSLMFSLIFNIFQKGFE